EDARLWQFFSQAEDGIRDLTVTGVQTCALPIYPASKRIVLQRLHFFSRVQQHSPWHIIIVVDCSGSMVDSVIYSAVMSGIFRGLPSMRVSLVAFDTSVVDMSDKVDDPAELLMSVQLGGGTNIGGALGYCQGLVNHPNQ